MKCTLAQLCPRVTTICTSHVVATHEHILSRNQLWGGKGIFMQLFKDTRAAAKICDINREKRHYLHY